MEGTLRNLFKEVDTDMNGTISIEELRSALRNDRIHHKLETFGIHLRDESAFFQTLMAMSGSEEGEDLDADTFVNGCLKMKGHASSLDVFAIYTQVQKLVEDLERADSKRSSAEPSA